MTSPRIIYCVILLLLVLLLANWKHLGKYYYPLKYRELIFQHAAQNGLDPLLVAAVIKTESNYRPDAVSARGAVGLMQLMPETARWVALQEQESFTPACLLDPETNIRLGTRYLSGLLREFGALVPALAAYNGGRGNVKKWLAEGKWTGRAADLDQIPFPETKQFIRKTLWAYRAYRSLYRSAASALTTAAHRAQMSGYSGFVPTDSLYIQQRAHFVPIARVT